MKWKEFLLRVWKDSGQPQDRFDDSLLVIEMTSPGFLQQEVVVKPGSTIEEAAADISGLLLQLKINSPESRDLRRKLIAQCGNMDSGIRN